MRKKDQEDIESGRATPAEVNARNAWIPNAADWTITNLVEASLALRKWRKRMKKGKD